MSSNCCSSVSESGPKGEFGLEMVEKAWCCEGGSLVRIGQVYVKPIGS